MVVFLYFMTFWAMDVIEFCLSKKIKKIGLPITIFMATAYFHKNLTLNSVFLHLTAQIQHSDRFPNLTLMHGSRYVYARPLNMHSFHVEQLAEINKENGAVAVLPFCA